MAVRLFGLDIGRSFIKIVEVANSSNQRVLKAAAFDYALFSSGSITK